MLESSECRHARPLGISLPEERRQFAMFTPRSNHLVVMILCLAGLAVAAGCSRKPDDNQITQSIQSQIQKESAIVGEVSVQSAEGVVTLNGHVSSEAERKLASSEAAQIPGVREVVNNLIVAPPAAESAQAITPPAPAPSPAVKNPKNNAPSRRRAENRRASAAERSEDNSAATYTPPPAPPAIPSPAPEQTAVALPPPPPPPPPAPKKHTIPAGTVLAVRLIDPLDSSRNRVGDTFRATLNAPIREEGEVVIPGGVEVQGRVVDASNAGRYSGHSELNLELTQLTFRGKVYSLQSQDYGRSTGGRGKGTAETVAAGAAIGAVIGALGGGGKGAAIGSVAGAGAGGAVRGAKAAEKVVFPSESVLNFTLQQPLTVVTMPDSSSEYGEPRRRMAPASQE
jgi:BON domain-containing protein